jgi:phosphoribosylanthranilate isomerase
MNALNKTLVKVCGITRLEDALALDTRVEYLGFNFWPGSKRFIEPSAAAPIIAALRQAIPVGVFVNHSAEEINAIAAQTGIRYAQLHGQESWDVMDGVALPVIKAIPHDRIADLAGLRDAWDDHAGKQPKYFLVDTQAAPALGGAFGGTGAVFDWDLLKGDPLPRPIFLAGGIGPENVAEAVRVAHPYAVDLNSKVETSPGVKDESLVQRCIEALT